MQRSMWLAGVLAVLGLIVVPAVAQQVVIDFENYTSNAPLAGQDGWLELVSGGGTAKVVDTDNGPSLPGSQCVELENAGGEIRLEKALVDLVSTYGPLVEFQYDVKLVTNQESSTPGGNTTWRTRLYDSLRGVAPVGNMHYDGGAGPACQVYASSTSDGLTGAWAPGGPAWTDDGWHTVRLTLYYNPVDSSGLFVRITFDGEYYSNWGWYFYDWNGDGTGIAQAADRLRMWLFSTTDGTDIWRVDNYQFFVADPTFPVADAGEDQLGLINESYEGLEVTLDASGSTGDIELYTWKVGDSILSSGPDPVQTVVLFGGTYNITLEVMDVYGLIATDETVVEVIDQLPPDNVWGPFGINNGDIYGRSQHTVVLPAGDLDLVVLNERDDLPDPDPDRQLLFDSQGNVYFGTWYDTIRSLNPDLSDRWESANLGCLRSMELIVGNQYVYAFGAPEDAGVFYPTAYALNKATGEIVWSTDLSTVSGETWNTCELSRPNLMLYEGKLYFVGPPLGGLVRNVYQIDAATGNVDWYSAVVAGGRENWAVDGSQVLIPDAFGPGVHGLYFQERSEGEADGIADAVGLEIDSDPLNGGATVAWGTDAGFADRSRVVYSPERNRLYMPNQWNWAGKCYWAFDPASGLITSLRPGESAEMAQDAAALSFDGATLHMGGSSGWLYSVTDEGDDTNYTVTARYYGAEVQKFGPRAILLSNTADEELLVTADQPGSVFPEPTDSTARVLVLNLTQDDPVTEEELDDGPLYIDNLEVLVGDDPQSLTTLYTYDFENLTLGDINGQDGWTANNYTGDGWPAPQVVDLAAEGIGTGKAVRIDPFGTGGRHDVYGWPWPDIVDPWFTYRYMVFKWDQYRADVTDNVYTWNDYDYDAAFQWDLTGTIWAGEARGPQADLTAGQWQTVERTYAFDANWETTQIRVFVDGVELDPAADPLTFQHINPSDPDFKPFPPILQVVDFSMDATAVSEHAPPPSEPVAEWVANEYDPVQYPQGTGWNWAQVEALSVSPTGDIYMMQFGTWCCPRRYVRLGLVASDPCAGQTLGDANCDGLVNAFDIDAFILALTDEAAWEAQYGSGGAGCNILCVADCDQDGGVNAFDIDPFIAILTGK